MPLKTRQPEPGFVPKVNILLYGGPKQGKTAGACSIGGGVLLINADLPNAAWYARSQDSEGRIQEVVLDSVLDTMTEVINMVQQPVKPGVDPVFETVVVDTVGELYRRLLDEVSDDALRKTLPQYGDTGTYIERFCRALCEAPSVNAVFVCHEAPVKNEATGVIETVPLTGTSNPALGQKLMGMVDVVGYTSRFAQEDNVEYVAQLIDADGRRGGDRFDCLDEGPGYRKLDLAEWQAVIAKKFGVPHAPAGQAAPPPQPKPARRRASTKTTERKAA